MTTRSIMAHTDVPPTAAPDDRLHNSGWGRPPEQYRTPGIGTGFIINVPALLSSWSGAPPECAEALGGVQPRRKRYARAVIARYAGALHTALGGAAIARASDPCHAIAQLDRLLAEQGFTSGVLLACSSQEEPVTPVILREGSDRGIAVQARRFPAAEHVAAALVAAACCRVPMVLWNTEPSLDHIAPNTILTARWLKRADASAAARAVWDALASAGATRTAT